MAYEETVSPILAFAALAAVFGALFLLVAVEVPAWVSVRAFLYDHTQKLMLLVAMAATAASLYYSEAVHFTPCEYCWYQRIAMYPLFAILAVAVLSRSRIEPRYLLTIAAIGLSLSIYHYQMQLFPEHAGVCSGGTSCTGRYVNQLGFITIPFMAGCGFLTILLLQVSEWRIDRLTRAAERAATTDARAARRTRLAN